MSGYYLAMPAKRRDQLAAKFAAQDATLSSVEGVCAMSAYTFDASWPILQPDRPLSVLVEEAMDLYAEMADEQRVELLGDPAWSIVRGRMHVEAPAAKSTAPLQHVGPVNRPGSRQAKVQAHIEDVREWAIEEHLTDPQISQRLAERYGITCTTADVRKARQRNDIPAGWNFPLDAGSGSVAAETAVSVVADGTATDPSISALAVAA